MWGYTDYPAIRRKVFGPPHRSGDHRLDGIFIASGPQIQKGKNIENAGIIDVTPTILHLMGLSLLESMDGRVLKEIFESDSEALKRKIRYEEPSVESKKEVHLSQKEVDEVKEKLRGLGYL